MPRSFLVKKIKLDDFSSSNGVTSGHHQHPDDSFTFARSITDSVTSLGVRLSENGELTCLQLKIPLAQLVWTPPNRRRPLLFRFLR